MLLHVAACLFVMHTLRNCSLLAYLRVQGGEKNRRLETEVLNIKPHLILTVIMSRGAYVRRL